MKQNKTKKIFFFEIHLQNTGASYERLRWSIPSKRRRKRVLVSKWPYKEVLLRFLVVHDGDENHEPWTITSRPSVGNRALASRPVGVSSPGQGNNRTERKGGWGDKMHGSTFVCNCSWLSCSANFRKFRVAIQTLNVTLLCKAILKVSKTQHKHGIKRKLTFIWHYYYFLLLSFGIILPTFQYCVAILQFQASGFPFSPGCFWCLGGDESHLPSFPWGLVGPGSGTERLCKRRATRGASEHNFASHAP